MNKEDGLLYLLEKRMPLQAQIQKSWYSSGQCGEVILLRYEDMLEDEHSVFEKIIQYCQIEIEHQKLHNIVMHNSFRTVTGREKGQENINEHLRKGLAGDWRNHFSPRVITEFKQQYGDLLILTGYENGKNW